MRALVPVFVVAACSSPATPRSLAMTTTFDITEFGGNGPSQLDPLQGQTIAISVTLDANVATGVPGSDPMGCKSRTIYDATPNTVASGATADLVQAQLLDMLSEWDATVENCIPASSSSIVFVSEPDAYNLEIGCSLPAQGVVIGADGYPEFTTLVIYHCNATILDVGAGRSLGNPDFPISVSTAPGRLP
jgi:hypothetical protein